jgi:pimeloyl-ACP methyl ester carboxylesterase
LISHLEAFWDEPRMNRFLTRLASFSRLIAMDPRGPGLSDRVVEAPTLDQRVTDLLAVLEAAQSERATAFGFADAGPACIAAAAVHPDRVAGLILYATYAKGSWDEGYPFGWKDEDWAAWKRAVETEWGAAIRVELLAPSLDGDEGFRQWFATLTRLGASPRTAVLLGEMTRTVDVRPLLRSVADPRRPVARAVRR